MNKKKGAKPESMKESYRDYLLRIYARTYPNLSMAQVGEEFGICKQRVSVILKGEQK